MGQKGSCTTQRKTNIMNDFKLQLNLYLPFILIGIITIVVLAYALIAS